MAESKPFTSEAAERLAQKLADWAKPVDPVEQFAGKPFVHHKNGARKFASYAHFPGTGPAGYFCKDCEHVRARQRAHGVISVAVCSQWKRMQPGGDATGINPMSESCKYFAIRAGAVVNE